MQGPYNCSIFAFDRGDDYDEYAHIMPNLNPHIVTPQPQLY